MTIPQAALMAVGLVFLGIAMSWAQPAPSVIPGCVYRAVEITMTNLQTTAVRCDINGKVQVH